MKRYFGTDSYDNMNHIDNIDDDTIRELTIIMRWIKESKIMNMDKESMAPFWTSGFVFTLSGELIIFNKK